MLFLSLACMPVSMRAQHMGIKSNILSDVSFSPNLGAEVRLSKHYSLDLTAHYNPYSSGDTKRWKHWMIQPELRYWLCDPFAGHFFGLHGLGGQYNVADVKLPFGLFPEVQDYRYEGFFIGGGLSYGYSWILSPRWGLEASLGVGYVSVDYSKYTCVKCGEKTEEGHKNWFGPTKASLSLIYLIK